MIADQIFVKVWLHLIEVFIPLLLDFDAEVLVQQGPMRAFNKAIGLGPANACSAALHLFELSARPQRFGGIVLVACSWLESDHEVSPDCVGTAMWLAVLGRPAWERGVFMEITRKWFVSILAYMHLFWKMAGELADVRPAVVVICFSSEIVRFSCGSQRGALPS